MSGYWAIGSTHTAMPPASVMMIDSTEAKIGRWMKKRENTAPPQVGLSESSGGSESRDFRRCVPGQIA